MTATVTATAPISPPRALPRHLLTVALLGAAGLAAWAVYLSSQATTPHPLHALARAEQRLALGLKSKIKVELAKEYRSVRAADTDTKAPPIPPSETWPAQ